MTMVHDELIQDGPTLCKPNLGRRDSQKFYEEAAPTSPVTKVKEFQFAVINGRPCRVIEKNKLGSEKWQITARDLFLWERIDEVLNTEDIVPDPLLIKEDYILGDITDEEYVLIDPRDSHVLKMPIPCPLIDQNVKRLRKKSYGGEIRITVGRTPIEVGIVDYRISKE